MKRMTLIRCVIIGCIGLLAPFLQASAAVGPTVRAMPDGIKTSTKHTAYAWAGKPLEVWGNVTWGDSTSGTAVGDFGDGSPTASGPVTTPQNIAMTHTYAAAGTYYATLTVTDGNGLSSLAQTRIDVLAVPDDQAKINLAIEKGLKWLYLNQYADGHWYYDYGPTAPTSLSVLAFENWGHLPIGASSDIYHDTVVKGLNFLFTQLEFRTYFPNWQPCDLNGNGYVLGLPQEEYYPHGMMMMAIAAAGPYDKNYPKTDAVHNPALNLTVPASVPNIGGQRYSDVLQDMMEYAAWGQADPGTWGRGGFRYSPNSGEADNSVGQWPVIGLEAAEGWDILAPAWVKSELKNYWLQNSYKSSVASWGYSGSDYCTIAHSGAGLCMMAYAGILKTDPWAVAAWNAVAANWGGPSSQTYHLRTYEGWGWDYWPSHFGPTASWGDLFNSYAMYGIAKAARIARDNTGSVSEVVQFGAGTPVHWYDEYSAYLLAKQQSNGSWPGWWYWGTPISTPFALLILEPTVSSLRPQAVITASPNPVNAGTTVNFDISGSTHQDPAKFLVAWKLIFDTTSGKTWASPDVSGTFPVSGPIPKIGGYPQSSPPADYDVTAILQVTDNAGETGEAVVTVHIQTGLVPPVANPGGPYSGSVGASLTLDGSASYDPNPGGSIVKYEWDLDGNGTYETDAGPNATIQHTWATPYTGQIGLRVMDSFGLSSTASVYTRITVCDLKPVAYPLISYRRLSRNVWEYNYKFVIKNVGTGDATTVAAQLQNWPAQVTVVDGNVSFPTVPAGGSPVTSTDTFTIRIDRTLPVQNSDLAWKLQFTDSGGTTWVLVNFPLY